MCSVQSESGGISTDRVYPGGWHVRQGRIVVSVVGVILLVVGLAACGGGDDGGDGGDEGAVATSAATGAPATGSYAGTVEGTDAYLAVVAGSQAVVAFATDGATFGEPFGGARDGDQADLESRSGATLSADITDDAVTGTVEFEGEEHPIALEPTEGPAGLYRAGGEVGDLPVWIGWVVLNDGSQLGAANTTDGIVEPPSVDTETGTITFDDVTAEVAKVEPDDSPADVEGPGDEAGGVFEGGAGFAGGFPQFGGFTQFGGGGFQGGFGGFGGGGGFQGGGFGGFGFGARMGG